MYFFSYLGCIAFSTVIVTSSVTPKTDQDQVSAGHVSLISQFQSTAGLEGLAIRPNGNLLAGEPSPSPNVWEFDPSARNGSAKTIVQFKGVTTVLGVTSIGHDIYAVTTGNVSSSSVGQVGTFAVNIVDYTTERPKITKQIPVIQGKLVNKITPLSPPGDVILVSDGQGYLVWSVNTKTSEVKVAIQDTKTMGPSGTFPIAINGIKTVGQYLYYVNTNQALFNRVKLGQDGTAAGPFETIANISSTMLLPVNLDVTPDHKAFIGGSNEVLYVAPDGQYNIIAGGQQTHVLAGMRSPLFGHGNNARTLYLTTTGKTNPPGDTTYQEPGKIASIPISC